MKTFFSQARNGLRRWSGAHPSAASWIALRDQETSVRETRKLEAHLKSCEMCRSKSQLLDQTLALFVEAGALSNDRQAAIDEGLEGLQEQIRGWRQAQGTQLRPVTIEAVKTKERWQHASAELEVYLGHKMTARLIEAARQSSKGVSGILATARPLLTGLLGERAAFDIATQLFKIVSSKETHA